MCLCMYELLNGNEVQQNNGTNETQYRKKESNSMNLFYKVRTKDLEEKLYCRNE